MQLARFNYFVDYLKNDHEIVRFTKALEIYRYFRDQWYDKDRKPVDNHLLTTCLESTRSSDAWREKKGRDVYFFVQELDSVVVATFLVPVRKSTRAQMSEAINRCFGRARDAFDADHDPLTGLLNRRGLERDLASICQKPQEPNGADKSPNDVPSLVLASLDLDFFKQVNDSFGHDYGDVVLQSFALRLEQAIGHLRTNLGGSYQFSLGRSGGEEFLFLAHGPINKDSLALIGRHLCESVSAKCVPEDDEWEQLAGVRPSGLNLPQKKDRALTVSIGISTPTHANPMKIDHLKREADIALYRAKASGRNQACFFANILSNYGRILQHHIGANIVAIDIGRLVGARVGQEFLVYHPDFVGTIPFLVADGRTKKRVGSYPRYSHGRLVVFEVQDEISFCQIAENNGNEPFQPGCVLELIPAGTISHLVDQRFKLPGTSGLIKPDDAAALAELLAVQNKLGAVVVLSLNNFDDIAERKGSVFANDLLAKLFGAARLSRNSVPTAQVSSSELAVILKDNDDPVAWTKKVLESVGTMTEGTGEFCAGLFLPHSSEPNMAVLPKHAIEYARYAAIIGIEDNDRTAQFNGDTAAKIINRSRLQKDPQKGIADWTRLRDIGVNHPAFHNVAGLCFLEIKPSDPKQAVSTFELAAKLSPKDHQIALNKAYADYSLGGAEAATDSFLNALKLMPKNAKAFPPIYLPRAALSLYAGFVSGKMIDQTYVQKILEESRQLFIDSKLETARFDAAIANIQTITKKS